MQCACPVFSSLDRPGQPYSCTLSDKGHDFRKKGTEHKMCVLICLKNLPEIFVILKALSEI